MKAGQSLTLPVPRHTLYEKMHCKMTNGKPAVSSMSTNRVLVGVLAT